MIGRRLVRYMLAMNRMLAICQVARWYWWLLESDEQLSVTQLRLRQ